jgi:anti-anti-sigma factor
MHNSLIQVRSKNGFVTVDLRGELDRSKADRLRSALGMARRLASHTVVIDTTHLDFIDLTAYRLVTAKDAGDSVGTVLVKGRAVGQLEAVLNEHPSVHGHAA